MPRLLPACLLFAVLLSGLSGCGQKGPLYLPVTLPRTIPPMPASTHTKPASTHAAPSVTHSATVAVKPD